jgi:hypothetical protein
MGGIQNVTVQFVFHLEVLKNVLCGVKAHQDPEKILKPTLIPQR